ncbi:MAG: ribonuclease III [Deltaproteobacteria bacterium]|nr:ribonuclease III [Deltaproteobacteria bacterium]
MSESDASAYAALEERLAHQFRDPRLCEQALTHKSWVNENQEGGRAHNERFEFLGDSVLALVISDLLMKRYPDSPEGDLSKTRAAVVNEDGLARVAESLALGQWIFLGRGEEQAGGRAKPSILADSLEALIGAVFVDAGFEAAYQTVQTLFSERLLDAQRVAGRDFKSRLQELSQAQVKSAPTYTVVAQTGPEHETTFEVAVFIGEREYARASGRSKKAAQQAAAARAIDLLDAELKSNNSSA